MQSASALRAVLAWSVLFLSFGYDYGLYDYGMQVLNAVFGNSCQLLRPASIYRCCIGKLGEAGRGADVIAADAQRRMVAANACSVRLHNPW